MNINIINKIINNINNNLYKNKAFVISLKNDIKEYFFRLDYTDDFIIKIEEEDTLYIKYVNYEYYFDINDISSIRIQV